MKLFDEDGNYVGEFVKDSLESVKDSATDSISDGSWLWGLFLLLFIYPGWAIFLGVLYLVIKLLWWIIKLVVSIVWWIVRLPFFLIFYKEFPDF